MTATPPPPQRGQFDGSDDQTGPQDKQGQWEQPSSSSWSTPPSLPEWGANSSTNEETQYQQSPSSYYQQNSANSQSWKDPQEPGIIPLRPLSVGDLLEGSFKAIRSNPGVIFLFSVTLIAIMSVTSYFVTQFFSPNTQSYLEFFQMLSQQGSQDEAHNIFAKAASSSLTGGLLGLIINILGYAILEGVLTVAVAEAVLGRSINLSQAWQRVKGRILPTIGASVLFAIILIISIIVVIVVVTIVFALIVMGIGPMAKQGGPATIVITVLLLALLALLVVYAIFSLIIVKFIFATPSVVLEQLGPVQSLKRSWNLTKKAFWRTFGRILLISLILSVFSALCGLIVSLVGSIFSVSVLAQLIVTFILSIIFSALYTPLSSSFLVLMYIDERMRKENFGQVLMQAAQEG